MGFRPPGDELFYTSKNIRGDNSINFDGCIGIFQIFDDSLAVEKIGNACILIRDREMHMPFPAIQQVGKLLHEISRALTGFGGDTDDIFPVGEDAHILITFAEDLNAGGLLGSKLTDQAFHDTNLCFPLGVGKVNDMEKNIGKGKLFQGGLEGFNEMGRQLADETDRITDENLLRLINAETAGGGIKGIKKPTRATTGIAFFSRRRRWVSRTLRTSESSSSSF